ncbi:MAG: alpha/beta fold hydrolase [Myxococcaceae bacterium]|nr:alpha/beta fold hydrolase [Myxococcaceae bacterium]
MSEHALPSWVEASEFPFQPRHVEVAPGEGLSVTDVGTGPVVVFSHGTPTWSYEWRHLVKGLSGTHRCLAVDHLGFGLSARPAGADYRPEAHAARFSRLVDALGLTRYHLVVHDFGGPFALHEALERPERVASLTVINSFCWAFGDSARTKVMASLAGTSLFRFLYGSVNLSFRIAASAWGQAQPATNETWAPYLGFFPDADSRRRVLWPLAKSMAGSAAFTESLWERRERLARTPMQLLWGLADSAFPPSALERWKRGFPHAAVHAHPDAGHWPHEEVPAFCLERVRALVGSARSPAT